MNLTASCAALFHRGHKALPCCLHLSSLNMALQPPRLLTPEMWQVSTIIICIAATLTQPWQELEASDAEPWTEPECWPGSLSPHRKSIPPGISTTLPQLRWIITEGSTRDSLKTSHSQNSLSTKNTFIFCPMQTGCWKELLYLFPSKRLNRQWTKWKQNRGTCFCSPSYERRKILFEGPHGIHTSFSLFSIQLQYSSGS